jgi:uncharacterized protein
MSAPARTAPGQTAPTQSGHGPDATYFAYLAARDWRIQKCRGCGAHVFQPRVMCPSCGAEAFDWVAPSGQGVVHSTTVVRRRPQDGGDYNVALIDLAEGVRMMSRVEGVAPTGVRIGMAVAARLVEQDDDTIVVFDPAEGGQ